MPRPSKPKPADAPSSDAVTDAQPTAQPTARKIPSKHLIRLAGLEEQVALAAETVSSLESSTASGDALVVAKHRLQAAEISLASFKSRIGAAE